MKTKKEMPRVAGLWDTATVVGSRVRITWIPSGYGLGKKIIPGTEYTISGVYHRIDRSGRARPGYTLSGIPGHIFRPEEIEFVGVCPGTNWAADSRLCGEITTGV